MDWARANHSAIFTHDLDFTTVLAMKHAAGPSVIQVRGELVLPEQIGPAVVGMIRQHKHELEQSDLVTLELARSRVRILPL